MQGRDIVVVGASAGGVDALSRLVRHLEPRIPATIFIVLHVSDTAPSLLPEILTRAGSLQAIHVDRATRFVPGTVYVAHPDRHLNVSNGWVFPRMGPRENGHRPAIDPLFRSAAESHGPRVSG